MLSPAPAQGGRKSGRMQQYLALFCLFVTLYGAGIYFHFDQNFIKDSVLLSSLDKRKETTQIHTPKLPAAIFGDAKSVRTSLTTDKGESGDSSNHNYEKIVQELHSEAARLEREIQDLQAQLAGTPIAKAPQAKKVETKAQDVLIAYPTPHIPKAGDGEVKVATVLKETTAAKTAIGESTKQPSVSALTPSAQGKPMILESANMMQSSDQAPPRAMLVVCGTDGSGTRKVVQTLADMGVLVVSEDPETYDIHGDLMGGWPVVVKPVIQNVKTLNYWPEDAAGENNRNSRATTPEQIAARSARPNVLPTSVHMAVGDSLRRLINQARLDSKKPQSFQLARGGALPRPAGSDARRVSFAFKAPVAMTLTPYWAHLEPHFKLLHVLRDGRDIAFSANQSPVQKFYADMYGSDSRDPRVKSIRLWSDWNAQVYTWATEYITRLRNMYSGSYGGDVASSNSHASPERSFSYMALHTEDLASEKVSDRYRAILALSRWVGSTLSQQALCCLAQSSAQFMGSHDRTSRADVRMSNRGDEQRELSRRYGKWRPVVKSSPQLGQMLGTAGKEGLELFGYEPPSALNYPPLNADGQDFQCTEPTAESARKCSSLNS